MLLENDEIKVGDMVLIVGMGKCPPHHKIMMGHTWIVQEPWGKGGGMGFTITDRYHKIMKVAISNVQIQKI